MTKRNEQLIRAYRILILLQHSRRGLSILEIVERLKETGHVVSKRTVYRDLEALEYAGLPVKQIDGEGNSGKRWILSSSLKGLIT